MDKMVRQFISESDISMAEKAEMLLMNKPLFSLFSEKRTLFVNEFGTLIPSVSEYVKKNISFFKKEYKKLFDYVESSNLKGYRLNIENWDLPYRSAEEIMETHLKEFGAKIPVLIYLWNHYDGDTKDISGFYFKIRDGITNILVKELYSLQDLIQTNLEEEKHTILLEKRNNRQAKKAQLKTEEEYSEEDNQTLPDGIMKIFREIYGEDYLPAEKRYITITPNKKNYLDDEISSLTEKGFITESQFVGVTYNGEEYNNVLNEKYPSIELRRDDFLLLNSDETRSSRIVHLNTQQRLKIENAISLFVNVLRFFKDRDDILFVFTVPKAKKKDIKTASEEIFEALYNNPSSSNRLRDWSIYANCLVNKNNSLSLFFYK